MKSNSGNLWARIVLEVVIFALCNLLGLLIRSPLTVGYDGKIVAGLMYALFLFAETFLLALVIGLKTEPSATVTVKGLVICIVAAFAFAFTYDLCERFFALVTVACLPELIVCMLVPLYVFQTEASNEFKKNIILIGSMLAFLTVLLIALLCLDGIKYSGFFARDTNTYNLWVRDAFKSIYPIMAAIVMLYEVILLAVQTRYRNKGNKKIKVIPRMATIFGLLFAAFALRIIVFPTGFLTFYEDSKVLEWNEQVENSLFSSVQRTRAYVQRSGEPEYIGLGGAYNVVVFDSEMKDEIIQFTTVTGVSDMDEIGQENFISELANEVVLIRESDGWKAFRTQELNKEDKNDLLTEAIWDGVDHGNMLMAVYASAYLKKNDPVEFQQRLNRWKQALFTEKETAKADIYSWTSIIEWANKQ